MFDRDDEACDLGDGWALFDKPPRKPLWGRIKTAWAAFMERDDDQALMADQREARLVSEITALAEENRQLRISLGIAPWEPIPLSGPKEESHV